jgi:hypothetical protein
LLVVAERVSGESTVAKGLSLLREQCVTVPLENLAPDETLALTTSLFDEAPHVERFADWLHGRTAGSPLHIVEISRQLVAQDVVRHDNGMWVLPAALPDVQLPEALEDTLAIRFKTLGPRALSLAQSLCLQRVAPSLALCQILVDEDETPRMDGSASRLGELLDELAKADVVVREQEGYRFRQLEVLGRAADTLAPRPVPLEVAQSSACVGDVVHTADTELVSVPKH